MTKLIDLVHHEHDHLTRIFEDLDEQFRRIARDGLDGEDLETARGDLALGLEEMLHHFDQEEAVFFVAISSQFPEMKEGVQKLVRMHEFICEQTQSLQRLLELKEAELLGRVDEAHDYVAVLRGALRTHARQENAFFASALERMSADEREKLLEEMRHV